MAPPDVVVPLELKLTIAGPVLGALGENVMTTTGAPVPTVIGLAEKTFFRPRSSTTLRITL